MSYRQRQRQPPRWTPPSRRHPASRGRPVSKKAGNVSSVTDAAKKNPWVTSAVVLAGAVALIYGIDMLLKRNKAKKAAAEQTQSVEAVKEAAKSGGHVRGGGSGKRRKKKVRFEGNPAASVIYSGETYPGYKNPHVPPNPANTYQSDLGRAGGVSPSMLTPYKPAPIDYAGTCQGANPNAVWQSTQLLPSNCGQTLEGTSDWELYAPSNYEVTNFLSAGYHLGTDTVQTSNKNANLQLRPEPVVVKYLNPPFGGSSYGGSNIEASDWSHSLVA